MWSHNLEKPGSRRKFHELSARHLAVSGLVGFLQ